MDNKIKEIIEAVLRVIFICALPFLFIYATEWFCVHLHIINMWSIYLPWGIGLIVALGLGVMVLRDLWRLW